jgi:hypothetical protein
MTSNQHPSHKRRLFAVGVKREAGAKRGDALKATLTDRIILRVMQAVGNHIRHLLKRSQIKAACGECSGT